MAKCRRYRCPPGTVTKSTKGRGAGIACMKRIPNAPRFVKRTRSGGCPPGARRKQTKRGMRCMGTAPGYRFVKPLCA